MKTVAAGLSRDFDLPAAYLRLADRADPFVPKRIPPPVGIHLAEHFQSLRCIELLHKCIEDNSENLCYWAAYGSRSSEKT